MKKRSKRWIAAAACVSVFCTPIMGYAETDAEAASRIVTNLEFDSMVTNAAPFGVTASKAAAYVRQPEEKVKNKVLEVTEPAGKSSVDVSLTESADSMTFSFDYMQKDTQIARNISIVDANAVVSNLLSIPCESWIRSYCKGWHNKRFFDSVHNAAPWLSVPVKCGYKYREECGSVFPLSRAVHRLLRQGKWRFPG